MSQYLNGWSKMGPCTRSAVMYQHPIMLPPIPLQQKFQPSRASPAEIQIPQSLVQPQQQVSQNYLQRNALLAQQQVSMPPQQQHFPPHLSAQQLQTPSHAQFPPSQQHFSTTQQPFPLSQQQQQQQQFPPSQQQQQHQFPPSQQQHQFPPSQQQQFQSSQPPFSSVPPQFSSLHLQPQQMQLQQQIPFGAQQAVGQSQVIIEPPGPASVIFSRPPHQASTAPAAVQPLGATQLTTSLMPITSNLFQQNPTPPQPDYSFSMVTQQPNEVGSWRPPPQHQNILRQQPQVNVQPEDAPATLIQTHVRPVVVPSQFPTNADFEYIVAPSSARDVPVREIPDRDISPEVQNRDTLAADLPSRDIPPRYQQDQSNLLQPRASVVETQNVTKQVDNERPPIDDTLNKAAFPPIAVGDHLPPAHIDLHGVCVNLQEFFEDRSGIIFGLIGAFEPVDTERAVPSILRCMESFERLVDFVGCLVVNDPFVVKAWAKKLGVTDHFTFIADSDAKFIKVLGMAQFLPREGLGVRSRRFAAVIGPKAKIRWIGFDEESFAENVLVVLPRFVRTPWKSFLVNVGYSSKESEANSESEQRLRDETVNTLQSMRSLLADQGFCSESDWQVLLCDKMAGVYIPTRDNIMNGLKWLVEGAQAGDVLCCYFGGKGGRFTGSDGTEYVGLLPVDFETAGPISESDLYDSLIPHVPEFCRLTIILDIHNEEPVTCPLPYKYTSEYSVNPSGYMETHIVTERDSVWQEKAGGQALKGEILSICLVGGNGSQVPSGYLCSLLNTVCESPPQTQEEKQQQGASSRAVNYSYADQMDRMLIQMIEWRTEQKSVQMACSRPLVLTEDFSLADVLP